MSYFNRQADPFLHLLKDDAPAAPAQGYDRAEAARRAWEVRRARFGPGGGNRKGGGKAAAPPKKEHHDKDGIPEQNTDAAAINRDLEQSLAKIKELAKGGSPLERKMPWSRQKATGKGINTSGIVDIDGKKYFAKLQKEREAQVESGVWEAAQALGWNDMGRPTAHFVQKGDYVNDDKRGVVLNPLLPEGESLHTSDDDGNTISRVDSAKVRAPKDKLERMMLFEYAVGAYDRHGGNYWWDKKTGDITGIDYARSFMAKSTPEVQPARRRRDQPTGEYGGIYRRSFNLEKTISRKHIEHVLANEEALIKAIPKQGGFTTAYPLAVSSMRERFAKMRNMLAYNPKKTSFDFIEHGLWREEK